MTKLNHISDGPVEIKVSDLQLDNENIRFGHLGSKLSESEIEDHLWEEEDCRVLYKQIVHDKQVLMPLYVVKSGKKYIAKDGNRRLTTVRKINADIQSGKKLKEFAKDHFSTLRCFVLKGTAQDVDLFLGSIHISGPKEWATANKAMHVYNLHTYHNMSFEEIGEELGMSKGRIDIYYRAFKATRKFGKKFGTDGGKYLRKYSYFDELFKSKDLKMWLDEDSGNLDKFMVWLDAGKLATYMDVRRLRDLIKTGNPTKAEVLRSMENKTTMETVHKTHRKNGATDSWKPINDSLRNVKNFSVSHLKEALTDSNKAKIIADLVSEALNLQSMLQKLGKTGAAVS